MQSDDQQLAKARLEAIYREMLPYVDRFASNRLGPDSGPEIASEVFHAAVVAFSDGRSEQVTPAWLMAVARNKVIDRWRREERRSAIGLKLRPRKEDLAEFPVDWNLQPHREAVQSSLARLPDKDRALLVLHYLDGIPLADLASQLDVSFSCISSRLARARRKFRRYYDVDRVASEKVLGGAAE